ncbi:hypothetical protein DXG01_010531 [Tephrocybe rancida]|nr:hypothetical protein DXG01_010531 [Tephrocybe rancida]
MKLKIEWASSFNSDGTSRKPDPSTMHGWYAKLRGTLSGNEDLRNKSQNSHSSTYLAAVDWHLSSDAPTDVAEGEPWQSILPPSL